MLIQAALVALAATLAAAVEPLEVRGQYFVNPKTGNRFQIVGVDYQPGGSAGYKPEAGKDPLSDGATCMRDVALMQVLGVNAMRVYNLDPNLNHDECASILNAAGIYMALDVNSPLVGESINSGAPWESYYLEYVNRTFAMVEAFKDYPNTLLFFAGNEVISNVATGATVPPYMRAVIRDLRAYVAKHASRPIPVGYSAADVREVLFDSWNYMQCGGPGLDDSRADIFGLNSYSWCGDATFKSSTYEQLVAGFTGTSVPIFFSEYGCNEVQPRLFTEVAALYSPEMSGVFSGGLVYEFSQEDNNYGIVKINADGSARLMNDFKVLMQQYAKLDFKGIQGSSLPSAATPKPPVCSKKLISSDGFNNNFTVPAMPPGVAGVLEKGVSPKPSGKLGTIKDFTVKQKVLDSNGNEIKGLAVVPVKDNGVNSPGVNSLEIAGGSGGGSNGNQPKKDAAPSTRASFLLLAGAMALTWLV